MTSTLEKLPAWTISISLHVFLILIFFILVFQPKTQKIDFEVLDYTQKEIKTLNLQPSKPKDEIKKKTEPLQRQVFGLSRKSLTATIDDSNAISAKQGNTVAKTPDQLQLNKNDADSLPIPADEYLVSQMPTLDSEFRIPYPDQAKRASIDGPVVMDLLIDQNGNVRKVDVVSGPGHGLNEAAAQAIMNFKFRPAKIENQNVAVRIRYTYRFVLENK